MGALEAFLRQLGKSLIPKSRGLAWKKSNWLSMWFKFNTVRLRASHSQLIPCVCSRPRFQGGCDHDAARMLRGTHAGCGHSGPAGGLEQGYPAGDYGASPFGNGPRPAKGLQVIAPGHALDRTGDGPADSFA